MRLKKSGRQATAKFLQSLALVAILTPLAASAIDGVVTMPDEQGGGAIAFTNAAAQSWVTNPDGTQDLLLKFTADNPGTFVLPGATKARILAIGGGGGGGGAYTSGFSGNYGGGGGGGAGGFVDSSNILYKATFQVTVGAGGPGGALGSIHGTTINYNGKDGGDTIIQNSTIGETLITAYGGGGGGGESTGNPGGSGGGGSMYQKNAKQGTANGGGEPTDVTPKQGNAGGLGDAGMFGGGGGGAGGPGAGVTASGKNPTGGEGKQSDITGADVWYAGGGGGGWSDATITTAPAGFENGVLGGSGVGGNGGVGTAVAPTAGAAETGSGGGGCWAKNYGEGQGGAAGGSGVVYVRISFAMAGAVKRPVMTDLTFSGEEQVLVPASVAYTIKLPGGSYVEGDYVGTNAGTYMATVALKFEGLEWEGGGSEPIAFARKIVPLQIVVTGLAQRGWMEGTPPDATPAPTYGINYVPATNTMTFAYAKSAGGPWSGDQPTAIGTYYIQATVADDPAGNYRGTVVVGANSFVISKGRGKVFVDYIEFTNLVYAGTSPETLADFPLRITLSEKDLPGFLYVRAGYDGEQMAVTDADDNLLPYAVDTWNVGGESVIYVRVPKISSDAVVLRLYWYVRPRAEVPDHMADKVFETWTQEDADAVSPYPTFGPDLVVKNGLRVNYFVILPDISRAVWDERVDESGVGVLTDGVLRDGATARTIRDAHGVVYETFDELKHKPGSYEVAYAPANPSAYEPLVESVHFSVLGHVRIDDLLVGGSSRTATGRILLMNDDAADGHEIEDQGYLQTEPSETGIFWAHDGVSSLDSAVFSLLLSSTHHTLMQTDGNGVTNELWALEDCFIGNTYYVDPTTKELRLPSAYCCLPWSTTGKAVTSTAETRLGLQKESSHIVMRNNTTAAVYSPIYTNGVGTLYFDIVNAMSDGPGAITVDLGTVDEAGAWTWTEQKIHALKVDSGAVTLGDVTERLTVCVTTGGTTEHFYRVYVPIDCRGTCRVRIRRVERTTAYMVDEGGFLLIDNVIVSYPKSDATMTPYGAYDKTLGWKKAMTEPFPSVGAPDVYGRAKVEPYVSPLADMDVSELVAAGELNYRWRVYDQASNDWQRLDLLMSDGYKSRKAMALPEDLSRIEFFFVAYLNAPYYDYYDYSGATADRSAKLGGFYTEENLYSTNTPANAFFNLREGAEIAEKFLLLTKSSAAEDAPVATNEMALAGDYLWRGFYQTQEASDEGIFVRFVRVNVQDPDDPEYDENTSFYTLGTEGTNAVPTSTTVEKASASTWSRVAVDAKTGYILFQIDTSSATAFGGSIVHADRQQFDRWTSAYRADHLFVGTSTDTNDMIAVSSQTRDFDGNVGAWHESNATNPAYWAEPFAVTAEQMGPGGDWEINKPFKSNLSPNRFPVGAGQWVPKYYRDTSTGMGLLMRNQGAGYIQFANAAVAPRGIDCVSFNARLGQSVAFDDFSYSFAQGLTVSNYMFVTQGAYDFNNRSLDSFSGNASLSVVIYYQPGKGCYELRVEQENALKSKDGVTITGAGDQKRLSIYRWQYDPRQGQLTATNLGSAVVTESKMLTTTTNKTTTASAKYGGLFISAKTLANETQIYAGVTRDVYALGDAGGRSHTSVWIKDTDPANRLTGGGYGCLAANCPGRFVRPLYCAGLPTFPGTFTTSLQKNNIDVSYPSEQTSCYDDLENGKWAVIRRRMSQFANSKTEFGLMAEPWAQNLTVYTAPKTNPSAWTPRTNMTLRTYGGAEKIKLHLWSLDDCVVKIATDADDEYAMDDIIISDVEYSQWRGESYDDEGQTTPFPDVDLGSPTNFVFTQGWMVTNAATGGIRCQLNGRRSRTSKSTAIRTPLLDGQETGRAGDPDHFKRGLGLGMITFNYTNAQKNAELTLQVCTNELLSANRLALITDATTDSEYWTDWTNFTFSAADEPGWGTRTVYLGIQGRPVAARLVIPKAKVESVQRETDESRFASIEITGVMCRDAPNIDRFAWWGWNLQTTDEKDKLSFEDLGSEYDDRLALALNNSTEEKTAEAPELYEAHLPFLQTPTFAGDYVGEVRFKARKYDDSFESCRVTLYGARADAAQDVETNWKALHYWTITNTLYRTCTHRLQQGQKYAAFRFAVTGVAGVKQRMPDPEPQEDPPLADPVQRVLIDDVAVLESIEARVSFRNVGAFRFGLDNDLEILDILDKAEQPLVKEAWGVQGELQVTQLAKEVDLHSAKVRLWWYDDGVKWGFDNWKNLAETKKAWLKPASDNSLVFRSSYVTCPDAIVDLSENARTVQYMLEVIWRTADGATECTNWLEQADWPKPSWYDPVDLNAGKDSFAAYTILDSVAPGWTWINEVNLFGDYDDNAVNTDVDYQYVEIAVPADADLQDWSVRMLLADTVSGTVVTNTVATFGYDGLAGMKPDNFGMASGMVFRVLASQATKDAQKLDPKEGELDGVWTFDNPDGIVFDPVTGTVNEMNPIGIQLVRPTGIVEHELVTIGTNFWADSPWMAEKFDPTNTVNFLNRKMASAKFFYAGADEGGLPKSLSVASSHGETSNRWDRAYVHTPGRINTDADGKPQVLPSNPPTPGGSSLLIYATLGPGGHLTQIIGEEEETDRDRIIVLPKGSETGTNIVYHLAEWYDLGDVTTNDVPVADREKLAERGYWTVNVGRGMSNSFTVVANAMVCEKLRNLGVDDDNRYKDAIMDWFSAGKDLYGNAWPDSDGEVYPVDFRDMGFNFVTNLDLTTMYWLDICPTRRNQHLMGGVSKAPEPVKTTVAKTLLMAGAGVDLPGDQSIENRRMSVYLAVTNTSSVGSSDWRATYAPYVIRGVEPGYTSWDFATNSLAGAWNGATLNIAGILMNGLTSKDQDVNWISLRWFVFVDGSFYGADSSDHRPFTADIEIEDPAIPGTPGYSTWGDWVKDVWQGEWGKSGWPQIFYRWQLNEKSGLYEAEILRPDSLLSE